MSGENQSQDTKQLSIEERLGKIDLLLQEYESGLGIPKTFKINTQDVEGYLQMSRDELKILDMEECAEISFALSQASFYIQKESNKERAKFNWADAQINGIIASKVSEYKGASFEERKLKAISDNSATMTLNKIKVNAKLRIDRLDGISQQIQFMSKSINDLKFAKRANQNG